MADWGTQDSSRVDIEDVDIAGLIDSTVKESQTISSDTITNDYRRDEDHRDMCLTNTDGSFFSLGRYLVDLVDGEKGKGSFGTVYLGFDKETREEVAVKKITVTTASDIKEIMKEIRVLEAVVHHENIVKMYEYHYRTTSYWICMEFCDLGDMEKYFEKNGPVSGEDQANLMLQCARGLGHLHHHNPSLVHRDIKPANIMLKMGFDGKPVVKITDFGLAKMVNLESQQARTAILSTLAGTPGFMSPEFFAQTKYTKSVDIFAMGLVFLTMIKFCPGDTNLIPLFDGPYEKKAVGKVMFECRQLGRASPPLVKDLPDDSPIILKIKLLVRDMAVENSKERIKISEVIDRLEKLMPPVPAPRKKKDISPQKSASKDKTEEDKPGVGYRLMKEAVDEKWRERGEDGRDRQLISMIQEDLEGINAMNIAPTPNEPATGNRISQDVTVKDEEGTGIKRKRPTIKPKFACGDVVRLPQGFTATGGNKKFLEQRAMVSAHDKDNNSITLEFATGLTHTMQADDVKHEDMAGQVIEDGDMVIICAERDKLRRLQNACGGYTSEMDNFLGKTGLVVQMYENNTARIQFSHDRRAWTLNTQAFKLLYKAEYLMQHYYKQ